LGCVRATTGFADIAMGFAGVLIDPEWLSGPGFDPPDIAWPVDDIWLSGHLARQNIAISIAPISIALGTPDLPFRELQRLVA